MRVPRGNREALDALIIASAGQRTALDLSIEAGCSLDHVRRRAKILDAPLKLRRQPRIGGQFASPKDVHCAHDDEHQEWLRGVRAAREARQRVAWERL
jgi:hypothetical protein